MKLTKNSEYNYNWKSDFKFLNLYFSSFSETL